MEAEGEEAVLRWKQKLEPCRATSQRMQAAVKGKETDHPLKLSGEA